MTDPWFPHRKATRNASVRLFCFPYAAKGASTYRSYADRLPAHIEVCAVQLPGREERLADPPLTSMEDLVEAVADAIGPYLDLPFAFYGQSMGAIVAFEVARALRARQSVAPQHLFVAREQAPHLLVPAALTNDRLSDDELLRDTRRAPLDSPLRANPEVLELMLPTYRADSLVLERYRYVRAEPLECPITAFVPQEDNTLSRQDVEAWHAHTSAAFRLEVLPGRGWELFGPEGEAAMCEAMVDELTFVT